MRVYRTQAGNAEPTVHSHYLYDAAGQRVKKVLRKTEGRIEATVYIDAIFEHSCVIRGHDRLENNVLRVMDME